MPQSQPGNQNAAKGKVWRDELKKSLKCYESKGENGVKRGTALRRIADRVVQDAIDGNKDAWTEIAIRLDGKPSQEITGLDNVPITLIQRVIIQQVIADSGGDNSHSAIDGEFVELVEGLPAVTVPPPLPSMIKLK